MPNLATITAVHGQEFSLSVKAPHQQHRFIYIEQVALKSHKTQLVVKVTHGPLIFLLARLWGARSSLATPTAVHCHEVCLERQVCSNQMSHTETLMSPTHKLPTKTSEALFFSGGTWPSYKAANKLR